MHGDHKLPAARLRHVLGEGAEILDVKIIGRIGGRQAPFDVARAGAAASTTAAAAANADNRSIVMTHGPKGGAVKNGPSTP